MDTNTLTPTVAAATLSSTNAHLGNRNLSTTPKRLAVIKVWDSMMRGAVGVARAQFILGQTDIRECVPFLININRDSVI